MEASLTEGSIDYRRGRFSNFRMDYLDMSHLVGDERYHDRLTYDGLWENNLY